MHITPSASDHRIQNGTRLYLRMKIDFSKNLRKFPISWMKHIKFNFSLRLDGNVDYSQFVAPTHLLQRGYYIE